MAEPLVLLPAMMCDGRLFAPQISALSGDFTLHLGSIGHADTIETLAQEALEAAPTRFALLGCGIGGMVALEMQRRSPDRITRLALSGTNPRAEKPSEAALREEQIVKVRAGQLEAVRREELNEGALSEGPNRAQILSMALRMAQDLGPEVYLNQCRALQRRPDQQKTLRRLKIPTLVLCGEDDRITPPRRHEFMATLVLGAQMEIIPGAAHYPTLENPALVNRILRAWLEQPLVLR